MPVKIIRVDPDSIASELGLKAGDEILEINGQPVQDYLDYLFLSTEDRINVLVRRRGEVVLYDIEAFGEPLGVEVEPIKPRACRCRCIFCFMDQMPKGLRKSLYFKDDDYRLSFLTGNYISLVGLGEEDWKRIEKLRLSPLYVSVHTLNPELRAFMMGHSEAAHIRDHLNRLFDAGVKVHTQIVVCPGINDGKELEETLKGLAGMYPNVLSVAVVPVGLTKYREDLYPVKPVGVEEARQILEIVLRLGNNFKRELGTRFAFPADELFIKTKASFPTVDFYEGFPQLEDGVGMVPLFLSMAKKLKKNLEDICFVTGRAFEPFLRKALARAEVEAFVLGVDNGFLGETVTVAGLLSGRDVVEALKSVSNKMALLPDVMFNDDGLTLDDFTLEDIAKFSGIEVKVLPSNAKDFWDALSQL